MKMTKRGECLVFWNKNKNTLPFSCWGLWLMLVAVGGFHTFLACGISAVFLLYFIFGKNNKQPVPLLGAGAVALLLVAAYALSSLWGVERGSAILGFFQFFPLPLYLLLAAREGEEQKALDTLPLFLGVMTLVSLLGSVLPVVKDYFTVAGRLGGFLQYPNTFGLLLLVGELLLLTKEQWKKVELGVLPLLILGILLTGSRTVFVLAVLGNLVGIFLVRNKKVRLGLLIALPVGVAVTVAVCLMTNNLDLLTRYLSLSVWESTFVGRLLYAYDALPVVLRHPFGLGYLGYAYLQPSFQTGVYQVMYAHNDFLQILLDVGWLPFLGLAALLGTCFVTKKLPLSRKLILGVMTAHALLDFDFQYVGVFALYLLLTHPVSLGQFSLKTPKMAGVVAGVLIAPCLYFGCFSAIGFFGGHDLSYKMLPFTTKGAVARVENPATTEQRQQLGELLVQHNPHYYLGYHLLGNCAYSSGDFGELIEYQTMAMERAPFNTEIYTMYAYELYQGVQMYSRAGDTTSARICHGELAGLENTVNRAMAKQSSLGKQIDDQPDFAQVKKTVQVLLNALEEEQ